MDINIGDKVKFLNAAGGGKVVRFVNKKVVEVRTEDGFDMPVMISELVKVEDNTHQYQNQSDDSQASDFEDKPDDVVEQQEIEEKDTDEINIYLGLVPLNQNNLVGSDVEAFLINDSNFDAIYLFADAHNDLSSKRQTGVIDANTKISLEKFQHSDLAEKPAFRFQFIFYKNKPYETKAPLQKDINIKPVKIFKEKSFKANDFFYERAMIIPLIEDSSFEQALKNLTDKQVQQVIQEKERISKKINQPKRYRSSNDPDKQEKIVDLHIHEIIDDENGLSNKEMLDIQLEHFRKELKAAQKENYKRIVFIHGVGNGRLKHELRRELEFKYKHLKYQDASFQEYGWGATLVILK